MNEILKIAFEIKASVLNRLSSCRFSEISPVPQGKDIYEHRAIGSNECSTNTILFIQNFSLWFIPGIIGVVLSFF